MRNLLLVTVLLLSACSIQFGTPPAATALPTPQPTPTATASAPVACVVMPETRIVIAEALHIRACAGTECQVLGYLYRGESIHVYGWTKHPEGHLWVCVDPDCTQWVNKTFTRGMRP